MEKACSICGEIFKVKNQFWFDKRKTCSYQCMYKSNSLKSKGKPVSDKKIQAIRSFKHIGMLGMRHSEESKMKMSRALKGKRKGCKLSKEHIEKLKSAMKIPGYKNSGQFKCGENHKRYKGSTYIRPNHKQHKFIMEKHLGRKLNKGECIHHIDGNPFNNTIENLMLFANNSDHIKYHHEQEKLKTN